MKAHASLVACAVVLLSGCASAPIGAVVDATPTSTSSAASALPPVPTPEAGTLVIAGSQLLIYPPDGTSTLSISYGEPSEAFRVALTDVFGFEPQFTHHDSEGDCDPSYDRYGWGEFALITNSSWIPDAHTVELNTSVASESGIAIVSSLGIGVGDDASAQLVHNSDFTTPMQFEGHTYTELYFDTTASSFTGGDGDTYVGSMGGLLGAKDDIVYVVAAPVIVGAGGSC